MERIFILEARFAEGRTYVTAHRDVLAALMKAASTGEAIEFRIDEWTYGYPLDGGWAERYNPTIRHYQQTRVSTRVVSASAISEAPPR